MFRDPTLEEIILDELCHNFDEEEMVTVHNEYCEMNSYYDDYINHMYELEEYCSGLTPLQILDKYNGINTSDEYFIETIYGAESFNYYKDCPVAAYKDIAKYCADNETGLWNTKLEKCIEEWQEEQEEPEEEDYEWSSEKEDKYRDHYWGLDS